MQVVLGHDAAGRTVQPDPCVTDKPIMDENIDEFPVLYPSCAVTRSISKQIENETKIAHENEIRCNNSENEIKLTDHN